MSDVHLDAASAATAPDPGLGRGSLGAVAIAMMVISAVAPLTNMAGVLPIAILFGNGTGIVPAFVATMVLVLVFSVGYVAMARHVTSAGAFFALIAAGLGRTAGGAAAMVALLGYNAMQIGVSGMFGPVTADLVASHLGIDLPWWVYSISASLGIGLLAYRRIDVSARLLGLLVLGEFAVILVLDLLIALKGVPGGFSLAPFAPHNLFAGGAVGITFVFAFGCYVGFEATTIYAEEARDPVRTIPRATYGAVLVVGLFYAVSTVWIVEAAGTEGIVSTVKALADPVQFVFIVAGRYGGPVLPEAMRLLFVTSLFACLLAFHNNVARYLYVLGRDGMLPAWLGRTHPVHRSPVHGTIVQTVLAILVIGAFAAAGLNPLLTLFAWIANIAVLCVVVLMAMASVAVIVFFRRHPGLEPGRPMRTLVLPSIAAASLSLVGVAGAASFGVLTGTSGVLALGLPALIPIAAAIGALRSRQRRRRPQPSEESLLA